MTISDKYDRLAPEFSTREYADPARYYQRRADAVVAVGPKLRPGDRLLDIACGDGGQAEPLLAHGLTYYGIDVSPKMIEVAKARLGDRGNVEVGDMFTYVPPEPVAATSCFRAIYYADDMRAAFEHFASYTTTKLVFDFSPRDYDRTKMVADLRAAGFANVVLRPLLYPQHYAPPRALDLLLRAAEHTGPLVRPLLKLRFTYVVAASR